MHPSQLPALGTQQDEKRRIEAWVAQHLQMQDGEERRAENLASEAERIRQAVQRIVLPGDIVPVPASESPARRAVSVAATASPVGLPAEAESETETETAATIALRAS